MYNHRKGGFFLKKLSNSRRREAAALAWLCLALLTGVWARGRQAALAEKLVRLHVIAVSDAPEDQAAKLRVRDAVLAELAPALESAADAQEAEKTVRTMLPRLRALAEEIGGVPARAELGRENYPTRVYDSFSLPAGRYTSLRITLGEGAGHNWWCVVYPPLCGADARAVEENEALTDGEKAIITEDGAGCVIRFRLLEWWGELTNRLDKTEE